VNLSLKLFDPNSLSIYVLIGAGSVVILSIMVFLIVLSLRSRINPLRRAKRQFERARYERALASIAIALKKSPENREALLLRADAETALQRYKDAASDYYRLINLKKPGDGIDTLDIKQKLLLPLYRAESLLELHTLCREILKTERTSPEALYYLGLLYIGQMYYDEARKKLDAVVRNRPNMGEAHFTLGVVYCQIGRFEEALQAFARAIDLDNRALYQVCCAATHFFKGDYRRSLEILKTVPQHEEAFEKTGQFQFALKLKAFCNCRLGRHDHALPLLQVMYNLRQQKVHHGVKLYNRDGRVKPNSSEFNGYYRLKEVAAEEGKVQWPAKHTHHILDLEGLSRVTEPAIDLGFAMVQAGSLDTASNLLTRIREEHPEVIGLGRIVDLIEEEQERLHSAQCDDPSRWRSKSTERVVRGKGSGYRLWEYLDEWERHAVRPFQLLIISDLTARRMLSPHVLFGHDRTHR